MVFCAGSLILPFDVLEKVLEAQHTEIDEVFEGFGLKAAQLVAALLILVVLVVFGVLRRLAASPVDDGPA